MYNIAVVPGDGIGPEVLREGLKVVRAAAEKLGFDYETVEYDFGGDRYLAQGGKEDPLPDSAISEFRDMDAIFLGAAQAKVQPGPLHQPASYQAVPGCGNSYQGQRP